MPFYEVLKYLITNPGKYKFRRYTWPISPLYITSIELIPGNIKISANHSKEKPLMLPWSPTPADIAADDWIEVE